ncbi:phage tail domain-containing protein [Pseudarthrobacter sp. ATCC 49987]|uniref:phage tail domain-containing protein n=1 Tax=Pseudarthrobacter sp. ATCC 49987 TaxID=2698204 RepID=UPI00136BDF08|nr:phage tail domain-containing protein [Pseudarthrobacter sp. ATCC 49987]
MSRVQTATVGALKFSTDGSLVMPEGYTIWLDRFDGWTNSTDVRRNRTEREGEHGEFSEPGKRGARMVTLEGDVTCPSEIVAARAELEISALLGDGGEGLLAVTDSALWPMSAAASLASGVKIGWKNDLTPTYLIQLLCADPRKYGATLADSTGVAVAAGALPYPLYAPAPPGVIDYGTPGSPGTVTLTNSGKADTAPRFTVTGNLPFGFSITDTVARTRLVYSGAIVSGQTLTLDVEDGSVLLDGYADRSKELTVSEWTRLPAGTTGTWFFEAVGSASAALMVEVNPAWW